MTRSEDVNRRLRELVGLNRAGLDRESPTGELLYGLVRQLSNLDDAIKFHAASIAFDMQRVVDGLEPMTLASSSDARNYEAAVSKRTALHGVLDGAVAAYLHAHPGPCDRHGRALEYGRTVRAVDAAAGVEPGTEGTVVGANNHDPRVWWTGQDEARAVGAWTVEFHEPAVTT